MKLLALLTPLALVVVAALALAANPEYDVPSHVLQAPYVLAVDRSECTKACEKRYSQCAKTSRDMKQCSDERKACYSRCDRSSPRG